MTTQESRRLTKINHDFETMMLTVTKHCWMARDIDDGQDNTRHTRPLGSSWQLVSFRSFTIC